MFLVDMRLGLVAEQRVEQKRNIFSVIFMRAINLKQSVLLKQTLKQTMKRLTVISFCRDEFCQEDHGASGHMDREDRVGREDKFRSSSAERQL